MGILLRCSCERRWSAVSEYATAQAAQAGHYLGSQLAFQAHSLTQLNGTPFIVAIFFVIFICIAIAVIVVAFMRTNNEPGDEETERAYDPAAPAGSPELHSMTGPLPPFMPLPHQTQPLSEIYYYNEQTQQPSPPPTLSDPSPEPPAQPEAPPSPMRPTGPLPGYYPNQ